MRGQAPESLPGDPGFQPQELTGTYIVRGVRPAVLWFAVQMEKKLRMNDHKRHWSTCENGYLTTRLAEEGAELFEAVDHGTSEAVIAEAADVANFAMMIADKHRPPRPQPTNWRDRD